MWRKNVGDIVTAAEYNTNARAYYHKSNGKNVSNTVTETDLLNGEVTVAAGDMGSSGMLRITCYGIFYNNSGATRDHPRFRVKLGAGPTTVLDTSTATGIGFAVSGTAYGWRAVIEISNGAVNQQIVNLNMTMSGQPVAGSSQVVYAVGGGVTYLGNGLMVSEGVAVAAIDSTVAMPVQFTVANPVATNLYELDSLNAMVELL